ncbi:spore coat protein YsxE [Bacillus sp. S/N-304-OC-R1]|uniref:spore coat protein YsxE n=1 Tax=Bacillus sp. S/N-304-OC-R1 TaxID=2758034 RepID=UPI001C8E4548|nr:spore coat protein YsxE [Bacillus sp. S/N-304-OC-R1]MBY0123975.1 spore coat protein YsxE [Bacillus sp. S/N-304-OC-R1]
MYEQNRLQRVAPILRHYGVEPNFVEDLGKVQKIYSNKGVFALKKIDPKQGGEFVRYVQSLYQKGYNRIVPIFPTLDGRYAVLHENELYYLMPWLINEINEISYERHHQLFRELARLHTLSASEIKISKEDRSEHYEKTLLEREKEQEFLTGFMEACELREYLSPFELMFVLSYNDISMALNYSINKLKDWYEKTKDHEKARIVTVHGKISTDHFLYDDRGYGYFSNFERAKEGSPLHDLLPFLSRTLKTYPKRSEECIEWIYTYLKYFPLRDDEMLLFQSYFAHPGAVVRAAETYFKNPYSHNERKILHHYQKQYWLLKNTEYVLSRMEEIERQKQEAKLQAQAQEEQQGGAQN